MHLLKKVVEMGINETNTMSVIGYLVGLPQDLPLQFKFPPDTSDGVFHILHSPSITLQLEKGGVGDLK